MERLYKLLEFFRITDQHDGLLSLTNLALIVVIVKLGFAQNASVVDLGTLFIAVLGYNAKKYMNKDLNVAPPEVSVDLSPVFANLEAMKEDLEKNTSKTDALMLKMGISR